MNRKDDKKYLKAIEERASKVLPEIEKRVMTGEDFSDILEKEVQRLNNPFVDDATVARDLMGSGIGQHIGTNYNLSGDEYAALRDKFYPELKHIPAEYVPAKDVKDIRGAYTDKPDKIYYDKDLPPNYQKGIIAHELGHAYDWSGKPNVKELEMPKILMPSTEDLIKETAGHHKGRQYEYDNIRRLIKQGKLRNVAVPVGVALGTAALSDNASASDVGVKPSELTEDVLRGALQGTTLGFGDELVGGAQALKEKLIDQSEQPLSELYRKYQKEQELANELSEQRSPVAYNIGDIGSSLLTGGALIKGASYVPKASKLLNLVSKAPDLAKIAATGATAGVGYAPGGSTPEELLLNAGIGAGVAGGLGAGISKGSKGFKKLKEIVTKK